MFGINPKKEHFKKVMLFDIIFMCYTPTSLQNAKQGLTEPRLVTRLRSNATRFNSGWRMITRLAQSLLFPKAAHPSILW
uniref:Uncharacterized protein n=1 Tax=Romanomermis culicivorax TaxID=13658 RepID=A0A915JEQ2_ROMCU